MFLVPILNAKLKEFAKSNLFDEFLAYPVDVSAFCRKTLQTIFRQICTILSIAMGLFVSVCVVCLCVCLLKSFA